MFEYLKLQDLCERHEKGVLNDHQRALQKMGQYKKKKMTAQNKDAGEVSYCVKNIQNFKHMGT